MITIKDLPLSSQMLAIPSRGPERSGQYEVFEDQYHAAVWWADGWMGALGNGGLWDFLSRNLHSGITFKSFTDSLRFIQANRMADLFEQCFNLFPARVLEDNEARRAWAWGISPGSEQVPDRINELEREIMDNLDSAEDRLVVFVLNNLDHYPDQRAFLAEYLTTGSTRTT